MGEKKIVVVQLSGGNDYLNCIIPYNNSDYLDNRPNVRITEERALPIGNGLGMNPSMAPIKELYDSGKVAVIHGTGYPVPNRSHLDPWIYGTRQNQQRLAMKVGWEMQLIKCILNMTTLLPQ